MDLAPMKRDIEDLIDQFAASDSTGFSDMKQVWLSKKFSFIYDARPTCTNSLALFMQSLYSHSIAHLISLESSSLSRRPLLPLLSPRDSALQSSFQDLHLPPGAQEASKANAMVKRLLEKKAFLFGSVEGLKGKVDELTELENARIQAACKKLFADTKIEELIHMDLGMEVDLGKVKQMSGDYADLKRIVAAAMRRYDGDDCQGLGCAEGSVL